MKYSLCISFILLIVLWAQESLLRPMQFGNCSLKTTVFWDLSKNQLDRDSSSCFWSIKRFHMNLLVSLMFIFNWHIKTKSAHNNETPCDCSLYVYIVRVQIRVSIWISPNISLYSKNIQNPLLKLLKYSVHPSMQ